ncbi:MarR family winged helix-turn-helix transcriptional regulator [Fictibacillus macauensis]|nr:MarR family transcriptional regulator [Fictibacillus macauensis]
MRELHHLISPKFERCTGMSASRLQLLHLLYDHGEISQSALQKEANIDSAAITRHLKQLEAQEKVVRRKNPEDHRVTLVTLTEQGIDEMDAYRRERDTFVTNLLQGFSDEELPTLLAMLHRIRDNANRIEG